jgi:hypothetical protein
MDPNEYFSGKDGAILIDDVLIEVIQEANYTATREPLKRAVIGKSAELQYDGPYNPEFSLKYIQSGFDLFFAVMTDAPTVGEAHTLHAGIGDPTTTPELTEMTLASCGTASRIELKALAAPVTTAGTITLTGTDVNDKPKAEVIVVPVMATNGAVRSKGFFKTVEFASSADYVQAGGTMSISSIVGGRTAKPSPKSKRMVVVMQATNSAGLRGILTIANTWPITHDFSMKGGASALMEPTTKFAIEDPDRDITFEETNV